MRHERAKVSDSSTSERSVLAGLPSSVAPRNFSLDQLDLFVHGRVVDISLLISEFGFTPGTWGAGSGSTTGG